MKNTKTILFDNDLQFEINLIGYLTLGESIVFFVKSNEKVIYSGVVDCYMYGRNKINRTIEILEENNVQSLDFICWTHPHADHTRGLLEVIEKYRTESTKLIMPNITSKDIELYPKSIQPVIRNIYRYLDKLHTTKIASEAKIYEKIIFRCVGKKYIMYIKGFAPDSNIELNCFANKEDFTGNECSVGLVIEIGEFSIVLGGDVENKTIEQVEEFCFEKPIDYIKIPHHSSTSSSKFINMVSEICGSKPNIACTTVYRGKKLPKKDILDQYCILCKEVYCTSSEKNNKYKYGVIVTKIDILKKTSEVIKTKVYNNAVSIKN